jgi:hypothetical protein
MVQAAGIEDHFVSPKQEVLQYTLLLLYGSRVMCNSF